MGKKFIESFVGECYRQGLSELQAWGVLNSAFEKRADYTQSQLTNMKDDPRFKVTPITTDDVSFVEDPSGWFEYYKQLLQNGWYNLFGNAADIRTPVYVTDTTMTPNHLISHGLSAVERAQRDLIFATRLKHRVHGEVEDNPAYEGMAIEEIAARQPIERAQAQKKDADARRANALAHISETQKIYPPDSQRYKDLELQKQHVESLYKKEIAGIDRNLRRIQVSLNGGEDAISAPYDYVLTDPAADRGAAERARNAELREKGFLNAIVDGNLFDWAVASWNKDADELAEAKHSQQQRQLEEARRETREAHDMIYGNLNETQRASIRADLAKVLSPASSIPADASTPVKAPAISTVTPSSAPSNVVATKAQPQPTEDALQTPAVEDQEEEVTEPAAH